MATLKKFDALYAKTIAESTVVTEKVDLTGGDYHVVAGRKVTSRGFTQAIDFDGKPMTFTTKDGKESTIYNGITEFWLKGEEELFKGEKHKQTSAGQIRPIIWFPNMKGPGKGLTIDGDLYVRAQQDPEEYPEVIAKLKEWDIPLNINCN